MRKELLSGILAAALSCLPAVSGMAQLSLAGTSFSVTADALPGSSFNASFDGVNVDGWFVEEGDNAFVNGMIYTEVPRWALPSARATASTRCNR